MHSSIIIIIEDKANRFMFALIRVRHIAEGCLPGYRSDWLGTTLRTTLRVKAKV